MSIVEILSQQRLTAIIRLPVIRHPVELARAFSEGGIKVLEFTLTSEGALEAVTLVKESLPDLTVGVGSATNLAHVYAAIDAGTDFIVSPVTKPHMIELCKTAGIAVMPGAFTPTEILHAAELGADVVKVFSVRSLGPNYIKDILAPMPHLKLMPTGGIDLTNIQDYLRAGVLAVGVGGNLINQAAIEAEDWEKVTEIAREYTAAIASV